MKKNRLKVLAAGLIFNSALLLGTNVQAQVPSAIEYSGKISNEAGPIDGTGYFKFALVDSEGAILWSNSSVAEGETVPSEAKTEEITEGVYDITLGDSENPIDASVFAEDGVKLQVWFTDAEDGEFELIADAAVNPVPTAILAGNATTAATATTATTAGTAAVATQANSIALVDADGEPIVDEETGEQVVLNSEELAKIASFRSNSLPHYDGATEYGMIKDKSVNWSVPFDVPVNSVAFSDESDIPGVTLGSKGTSNIKGTPNTAGEYKVSVLGTNAAGDTAEMEITFKVGSVSIEDVNAVKAYIGSDVIDNDDVKIYAGGDVDLKFTPTADIPLNGYKWVWDTSKEATVAAPAAAGDAVEYTISGIGNDTNHKSAKSYTVDYQASAVYGIGDNAYSLGGNGKVTLTVNAGYSAKIDPAFPFGDQNPGVNEDLSIAVSTSAEDSKAHSYTYQWQYDRDPSSTEDYVDIPGETSSKLKLDKFYDQTVAYDYTGADAGLAANAELPLGAETGYQCVVFDGYYKMSTAASTLSVANDLSNPVITVKDTDGNNPTVVSTIKAGTQARLEVTALTPTSGETVSYQWMKASELDSSKNPKKYAKIANAVGGSYKTAALDATSTKLDRSYRLVASTPYGSSSSDATVNIENNWKFLQRDDATTLGADNIDLSSAVAADYWYEADGKAANLLVAVHSDTGAGATNKFIAATDAANSAKEAYGVNGSGALLEYSDGADPDDEEEVAGDYFVIAFNTYIDTASGEVSVGTDSANKTIMTSNPKDSVNVEVWVDSEGAYSNKLDSTDYKLPSTSLAKLNDGGVTGVFVSKPNKDSATGKYQVEPIGNKNYAVTTTTIMLTIGDLTIDKDTNTRIKPDSKIYIKVSSSADADSDNGDIITINL